VLIDRGKDENGKGQHSDKNARAISCPYLFGASAFVVEA
jgi:hypothetical protein